MRRALALLGCAVVITVASCSATPTPGSLVLIGNEGSVCFPSREGMLFQLGGIAIEDVGEGMEAQHVEFLEQHNSNLRGAYVLPLNGASDLVGFDLVDESWASRLPPEAIPLGQDPVPLKPGQTYNLVVVVAAVDESEAASVSGIALRYTEGGSDRIESVIDEAVLPALGVSC